MFIKRGLAGLVMVSSLAFGDFDNMRDEMDSGISISIDEMIESMKLEKEKRSLSNSDTMKRSYKNENRSIADALLGKWSVEYKIKSYYYDTLKVDKVTYNEDLGYIATGDVDGKFTMCSYYKIIDSIGGYLCVFSANNIYAVYSFDLDGNSMKNAYFGISSNYKEALNIANSKMIPMSGYRVSSSSISSSSSSVSTATTCEYSASDITSAKEEQKALCKANPSSCGIVLAEPSEKVVVEEKIVEVDAKISKEIVDSLESGWSLLGTGGKIQDMGVFSSAKKIFVYKNSSWKSYEVEKNYNLGSPPTIPSFYIEKFDGFWIYK